MFNNNTKNKLTFLYKQLLTKEQVTSIYNIFQNYLLLFVMESFQKGYKIFMSCTCKCDGSKSLVFCKISFSFGVQDKGVAKGLDGHFV